MRSKLRSAAIACLLLGMGGCSRNSADQEKLLAGDTIFSAPIAVLLPAQDDSKLYDDVIAGRQAVGGLVTLPGCHMGWLFQRARSDNFFGQLDIQNLTYANWASIRSIQIP